jgi:outer membrane protein assembly factor BamB
VKPDPLIFNDFVILAGRRHVYALDPLTGDTRWETEMASPVFRGPITDGSGLYFLGQDGSVQGLAARDGRLRWRSATLYGPQAFPPIMAGGRIVVASGNRLVAVARTGHPTWTAEMPTGVGAQPTVAGDTLYVPCVDGRIYPLYARSGRTQRRASIDLNGAATSPLLVVGGMMLGGTSGAQVVAADLAAGEVQWAYRCRGPDQPAGEAAEYGIYAPLVESDGYVLALTGAGDLYCFSPSAPDVTEPLFSELTPEPGSAVSGKETVKVSFVVVDDGSGLNPALVTLTVDGKPARLKFESTTGKGELEIREMADGIHIVKAEAADFRGNTGSEEWSFLTDKSIAP